MIKILAKCINRCFDKRTTNGTQIIIYMKKFIVIIFQPKSLRLDRVHPRRFSVKHASCSLVESRVLKRLRVLGDKAAQQTWPRVERRTILELSSPRADNIVAFSRPRRPKVPTVAAGIGRRGCTFAQGLAQSLGGCRGCTKTAASRRNLFRVSRGRCEAKHNDLRTPSSHDGAVSALRTRNPTADTAITR